MCPVTAANQDAEHKVNARLESWVRLARFVAVGGINTVFGYSLYAALIWAGVPAEIALLLSTVLGVLFNFVTYGRLAFGRPLDRHSLVRFIATYVVFYGINALLLRVLLAAGNSPYLAQLILLVPMTLGTFLAQRYFVFRVRAGSGDNLNQN